MVKNLDSKVRRSSLAVTQSLTDWVTLAKLYHAFEPQALHLYPGWVHSLTPSLIHSFIHTTNTY